MPDLALVQAHQPFRLTAYFAASDSSQVDASTYTLKRGGVVGCEIESAWRRGGGAVELALVEPLLPGERYTLTQSAASNTLSVAYTAPLAPPTVPERATLARSEADDPEAEAFGLDVDWFGAELTPAGDVPVVKGLAALRHDLAALAVLHPGELLHRPGAGLGLSTRVNGAAEGVRAEMEADTRAAYLADTRVRDARVAITQEAERTILRATITTPPLTREAVSLAVRLTP